MSCRMPAFASDSNTLSRVDYGLQTHGQRWSIKVQICDSCNVCNDSLLFTHAVAAHVAVQCPLVFPIYLPTYLPNTSLHYHAHTHNSCKQQSQRIRPHQQGWWWRCCW